MGFLLKIAIFAVVGYGIWTTARRWLGLFGGQPQAAGAAAARGRAAHRAGPWSRRRVCARSVGPTLRPMRPNAAAPIALRADPPGRLTGWGALPILPHRKNGLKWRKHKAF